MKEGQKKDLAGRADIEAVLNLFYRRAFADAQIGHFFTEVVPLDLETHIPVIADFWESVVFGTQGYRKNVMQVHAHIHALSAIRKADLVRWAGLFTATVSELFEGEKATLMQHRARSIATLMDIKLNHQSIEKK